MQLIPKRLTGFFRLHAVALGAVLLLLFTWFSGAWEDDGSWTARLLTALGVLGCVAVAIQKYRSLTRDLLHIESAVLGVTSADSARPYLSAGGELTELSAAMNRMFVGVTERQQRLSELAARMSTVLAAMVEGVLAVDDRQHVLFANAAAGRLLGFDPLEARGKRLLEVVRNHMLHEAVSESFANRDLPNQETRRYEFDSHQSRGQVLSFRATRLEGTPCPGVVLVLQDITELRRLEHLRQEFVANVSHELKTPLTAIKAYAETLQAGAIDKAEVNRDFLTKIEIEADRLNGMIGDMLSLAKIESGHAPFEMTSVNLMQAVDDCVKRYSTIAARKRITLERVGDDQNILVRADQDGLFTIIDNLVENAVKYTDAGGTISLAYSDNENGRASILIRDTGIGIPDEYQSRVFERFFRVDQARSRELGSTGLGLAIVKHLAQSFGGNVVVCSQKGQGSTFRVQLLKDG